MSPHSDSYLIQALLDHNTSVIRTIYDQYAAQIMRFVRNNKGSAEDAQDIFQEALITITRQARDGFVLTCPFGGYLYLVCRGKWLTELERRSRRKVTFDEAIGFSDKEDVFHLAEQALREDARDRLFLQCFEKLPDSCQQILRLAWSGLSLEEVGVNLNRKYGYVRKRKSECTGMFYDMVQNAPEYEDLR